MQRTMLEATPTSANNNADNDNNCLLTPATTQHTDYNADNDVRSANNYDNTGYCDNLSTLTTMQTTMLEAPTTMTTLATATSSAH